MSSFHMFAPHRTSGAIFQTALLEPEILRKNFADLAFFQQLIPAICDRTMVCIATFADKEEEALCSGADLVRKYLDAAFDNDSARFIAGEHV